MNTADLTIAQRRILDTVVANPGQTAIGLRDALGFPRTTRALENVQAGLADLVGLGLVGRETTAGMSTYTVAAQPEQARPISVQVNRTDAIATHIAGSDQWRVVAAGQYLGTVTDKGPGRGWVVEGYEGVHDDLHAAGQWLAAKFREGAEPRDARTPSKRALVLRDALQGQLLDVETDLAAAKAVATEALADLAAAQRLLDRAQVAHDKAQHALHEAQADADHLRQALESL